MPKTKPISDKKICIAALQLAAKQGWPALTLEQIARAAKIPAAQVTKNFSGKNELLPALVKFISDETTAAVGKSDRTAAPHDRLFEIMMARFDVLQKHRAGILAIAAAACRDSSMVCRLLPAQEQAMEQILIQAGLGQQGPRGRLTAIGLGLVYMIALRVWRTDETLDMTKTMAALDRALRGAGRMAEIIFRFG